MRSTPKCRQSRNERVQDDPRDEESDHPVGPSPICCDQPSEEQGGPEIYAHVLGDVHGSDGFVACAQSGNLEHLAEDQEPDEGPEEPPPMGR